MKPGRIGTDAATGLIRALRTSARAANCAMTIVATDETPWASATFAGTRHRIVLADVADPAVAAWLAMLPDADLAIRGHVVVDVAVDDATLHVLTVADS